MRLSSQQFSRLKHELEDAFSDKSSLDMMARMARNKSLDQLALGDSVEEIIFKLIRRAEDEGWLADLLEAAIQQRPQHNGLHQVLADLKLQPALQKAMGETSMDRLQEQAFHRALLSAFPSAAVLAQMLRFEMDVNLAEIAGDDNLQQTAFEVLRWARTTGRMDELLAAARNANPGNPELRAFAQHLTEQVAAPMQVAPAGPTNVRPDTMAGTSTPDTQKATSKQQLRKVLIDKYPTFGELNLLCADLTETLQSNNQNIVVSVARLGGTTLEETALNLISFLDRRSALQYLLDKIRHDYPNSI